MQMFKKLILLVAVLGFGVGLDLPPEFQKCKVSGENVNECLKVAIQDALPKLKDGLHSFNVDKIDPLLVSSMIIGEGTGTVHVVQNFKNIYVHGISDAKIEKIEASIKPTTLTLNVDAFLSDLKLEGGYDFNGRILVLPIVGVGNCTIKLDKLKAILVFSGEAFEKKGKTYMEIKDVKLTLKPGKVEFNFENLFNGDERLGTEINHVLNANWKEVFEDVRSGYEDALALIIKNVANLIFKKVPYAALFSP